MAIDFTAISRAYVEIESTFASVLHSGWSSTGSAVALPIIEGSASLTYTQDMLDPQHQQQYKFQYPEKILGKKSAKFTFSLPLHSTGTAASSGVAAVVSPLGYLLHYTMGGEDLGTGSTSTATSTTALTVNSTAGFTANTAMGTTVSGSTEWRIINSISGSDLNAKLAFSGSPTTGTVYSSASYYLTQDTPNDSSSLQFLVQSPDGNNAFALLGCQLTSMSIEVTSGEIPRITFEFSAASWSNVNATVTNFNAVTYSNFQPVPNVAGQFYRWTNGTTTYTASTGTTDGSQIHVSQETWATGLTHQAVTSPSGTNTIFRWIRGRSRGASGTFNAPFFAQTWFTARDNATDLGFQRVFGGTAGSTVILHAPTCQIVDVQVVDDNGLVYNQVTWEGRNDADTGGSTDQALSPLSIHLC